MELTTLWRTAGGFELRGTVVGTLGGAALATRYRVECTSAWQTRKVWVEVTRPPDVQEMTIHVEDDRRWFVDGSERADLAGLIDVDIQITPATNTLPIRRLALAVGDEAEVTAAWAQFPELVVSPLVQRYRRTGERQYRYRSNGFQADLEVDEHGLVERYGSSWRRVRPRT